MNVNRRGFMGMFAGAVAGVAARLSGIPLPVAPVPPAAYHTYLVGKEAILSDLKEKFVKHDARFHTSYNVRFAVGLPPERTARVRWVG